MILIRAKCFDLSVLIIKSDRPDNVWYTQGVAEQYYLEMCNKYQLLGNTHTQGQLNWL